MYQKLIYFNSFTKHIKFMLFVILFCILYTTKGLSFGLTAESLRKEEKIQKMFSSFQETKDYNQSKWIYKYNLNKHIFIHIYNKIKKVYVFNRRELKVIINIKINNQKVNNYIIKSMIYCSFNNEKTCLEINNMIKTKIIIPIFDIYSNFRLYYDMNNSNLLEEIQ